MAAVNVSEDVMEDIELIIEESKWSPSKKEIVEKAIKEFKKSEGIEQ